MEVSGFLLHWTVLSSIYIHIMILNFYSHDTSLTYGGVWLSAPLDCFINIVFDKQRGIVSSINKGVILFVCSFVC